MKYTLRIFHITTDETIDTVQGDDARALLDEAARKHPQEYVRCRFVDVDVDGNPAGLPDLGRGAWK